MSLLDAPAQPTAERDDFLLSAPTGHGDFALDDDRDATVPVEQQGPWYRTTWPLHRWEWAGLLRALAVVVAVGTTIGLLLYRLFPNNPIVSADERVADWFVSQRSDERDTIATWSARLADTPVKVGISLIAAAAAVWLWRRWHEAVWIALTLTFEATAFITISFIVHRQRPAVERLLDSPVDTSFPSGHVAAATVYGAFAVIVFWHTRSTVLRTAAVSICTAVVLVVATARMYQGMHFLSDVVGGVILGVVSIVLCGRILGPPPGAIDTPITRMSPRYDVAGRNLG